MSSSAPIQDVAEVLIRSVVNDKPVELCLWFRSHLGTITTARLTTIATRVRNAWRFNFAGSLASGVLFKEVVAIDRSSSSISPVSITDNVMVGFGGAAGPTSIALGLLNLTDSTPTFPRSESFIYAIPDSRLVGGVVEASYAAGRLALWASNNQSHGPFGWHHVAVSLYSGGAPRASGVVERVTHYAIARLNPAAQRRRLTDR
jgi:hypothetical protein